MRIQLILLLLSFGILGYGQNAEKYHPKPYDIVEMGVGLELEGIAPVGTLPQETHLPFAAMLNVQNRVSLLEGILGLGYKEAFSASGLCLSLSFNYYPLKKTRFYVGPELNFIAPLDSERNNFNTRSVSIIMVNLGYNFKLLSNQYNWYVEVGYQGEPNNPYNGVGLSLRYLFK